MWYFYVLKSNGRNWFYRGSTADLKVRVMQHNNGLVQSTKPYLPLELVYYEAYRSEQAARRRESKVKLSGSVRVPLRKRILASLDRQ